MTTDEYKVILDFVQNHHKFALYLSDKEAEVRKLLFPKLDRYGFNIKYVDSCYDSRDGVIWQVVFREANRRIVMREINTPKGFKSHSDWCMAYLRGEWKPTKEFIDSND